MKNLGYYNGIIDEIEKMTIPMCDRVCFFGDGIYDATYSRNYNIFALNDHVDRFFNSAKLLKINIPHTKSQLKALLIDMVEKMDTGENFVYFQATRGLSPVRNHLFPQTEKANIWINIFHKKIEDVYRKVNLITVEDTRFFHCNIKTLNLIPSVMASQKAKEMNCDEAIFHRNGRVTECSHSNVHIIKDGKFITPPTDNLILAGVARKRLILACNRLNIPVLEKPFTVKTLLSADEVIISSAGQLCLSASTVDKTAVGNKAPQILSALQKEVLNEFIKETDMLK
ncbi:MAG: aminotransferase class IV [Clostridia bacterium]|nr:aminotransferase class IV [Clostridia bacterium]